MSSNSKSSGDIVRHNSTKKTVSGNVLYDSKHSTSESKPKSTRDSKGEIRNIVADDNKEQGRLPKQDTSSTNPTLSKIDKPSDNSRKKELVSLLVYTVNVMFKRELISQPVLRKSRGVCILICAHCCVHTYVLIRKVLYADDLG